MRSSGKEISPLDIAQLAQDQELRLFDHPELMRAAYLLERDPDDRDLLEILEHGVAWQSLAAVSAADAFWPNYPPKEIAPVCDIPILMTPLGQIMGPSLGSLMRGTGIIGPSGSGKSSVLRLLLVQLSEHGCVIVIDRKRELRSLLTLPHYGANWKVLRAQSLPIALVQPPPNVTQVNWNTQLVDLVARNYSLYASTRPLLHLLDKACRKFGEEANLRTWFDQVRAWQTGKGYREIGYKEAIIWVLSGLLRALPNINHAESNALNLLFSKRGGTIVEVDGLPTEHYVFFVSYLHRWLYESRQHSL